MVDNKSVTRLNLSSNALGAESVTALSSALKERGCPLAILDLSCNNLEDPHVLTIAQVR
jgi:Leucine-rich repeat (LRR) protein